jgi:type II secretory pathway pseudopilin PulG
MKNSPPNSRSGAAGFTLVEIMVSMTVSLLVVGAAMSTFIFGLRTMYKDTQRLASNASLRSFMAQISNETIDASYFYLFPYYTSLDGSVNLATDPATLATDTGEFTAHGDCLVLVTKTSQFRSTDIRQIKIYYRVTTNHASMNAEAPLRYYETADWGEGTSGASNGHPISALATDLNTINLNSTPVFTGSKLINARSKGRAATSPYLTGYSAGDFFPIFSSESPTLTSTTGFIALNVEFINGANSGANRLLSSSSFNYTISPRR